MTELEVLQFVAAKMFFAVVCGSIVGIERELNRAAAGFKTQILICVGSMLFTVVPSLSNLPGLTGETGRVVAQIVSGVGFLGAGAILHGSGNQVVGLTTAACIWFTAALGIMIGLDHGGAATFIAFSLVAVITFARKIERRFFAVNRENVYPLKHKHQKEDSEKKRAS